MGCNLLKHAYNHFDTHETLHHDMILNHHIDRLPYQYNIYRRSLVCPCAVYAHACACVYACVDTSVYIYAQVSSSLREYVKIYHISGTFNKHLSLGIFDEHLVRQTNQGLPKIFPQYPLETALTVT